MSLELSVDGDRWRSHLRHVAETTPGVNGITTTAVKSSTGQDLRMFILDSIDASTSGQIVNRDIIPSGEVTEVADITRKGADETLYELTITPYPDSSGVMYINITNDPAMAV